MKIITSDLKASETLFLENQQQYLELSAQLRNLKTQANAPESADAANRHKDSGKLLTRQRIAALLDIGSAQLPLAELAGLDCYDGVPPGAGIQTVIGTIAGIRSMVIANDPTVKGGTYFPLTVKKHLRAQQIALENRLPCVYLVDSGGAFLPLQAEVFPDQQHFGRIFNNQALMSAAGIPQIAVVLGSCTAGGAYVPAMSDQTIMVRGQSTIFLGGPPLVKAATGVEVSAEELGGADVHTKQSGVADYACDSELEALQQARDIIATLNLKEDKDVSKYFGAPVAAEQPSEEPRYDPAELYGIVGTDVRKSFSTKEVLARLLDGSRFDEFKARYAESIICGFGHIHGILVGVVANNGILFGESALKAAHFIELCDQRRIPMLFIHNIVGFMVGKDYEAGGIAKDGAKMVTAVATATTPKLSLVIGGSFGAGNYGMCGRAFDPRFLFTWPNSRISVMGGQQAAEVLAEVRRGAAMRSNKPINEAELLTYKTEIFNSYEKEGSPYYATARLWDDGIIDPLTTRASLAMALSSCLVNKLQPRTAGVFRM